MRLLRLFDRVITAIADTGYKFERGNATPLMLEADKLADKLATLLPDTFSTSPQDAARRNIIFSKIDLLRPYISGEYSDPLAYDTIALDCESFYEEFSKVKNVHAYIKEKGIVFKR